jgi:hypothetical protein
MRKRTMIDRHGHASLIGAALATTDSPPPRAYREGQRLLSGYVDANTLRAVRSLAAEQDTTNIALMHEAVALLLKRHGKPIPDSVLDHLNENHRPLPDAHKGKTNGHRPG